MVRVAQGRVTISGKCVSGAETWSMGFSLTQVDSKTDAELQAAVDVLAFHFETQIWSSGTLLPLFPASTTWESVRLDDVRNPGGILRSVFAVLGTPIAGTSASGALPPQNSLVVSLRTPLPGGRARGRMYLPPMATNVLSSVGQLTTTNQSAVVARFADFFSVINADTTVDENTVVASDAGQFLTAVTSVQVGKVMDTQRRRRDELLETPVSDVVTP